MIHTRTASSRPLRALVVLLFLWSIGRAAYQLTALVDAARQISPAAAREVPADNLHRPPNPQLRLDPADTNLLQVRATIRSQRSVAAARRLSKPVLGVYRQSESPAPTQTVQISTESPANPADTKIEVPSRPGSPHRLSLSSWLLVRDGATGIAPAGTLGGAQVGVRAYLSIMDGVAATARVSTPLRISGAEASAGVALRRGPVTVLLERRIALGRGGRNDFSATLAAGIDGIRLPKQFRLDAYGQAGIVGRDGFADGALRIERRIGGEGKTEIALGAGVWGGAQPGISRLDTGPQIVFRTPIAGGNLRASGEWRQRIAGNAQPASGPAMTLGMDF